jgi:hypothetical protein
MVAEGGRVKTAQIAAGIAFAAGAGYSLYTGKTGLAVFFASLLAVALLAPGLLSRTSEVSFGSFRASFKDRIDGLSALSEEEKRDYKKRIDGARSFEEALDIFASLAGERLNRNG